MENTESARESASRFIGKYGMPLIVFLVCVGVFAASFLSSEALTPVIGLVATAAMALIGILTGTKSRLKLALFSNNLISPCSACFLNLL